MNGDTKWSSGSLRVSSAVRRSSEISAVMGCEPSFSADRGDPVTPRNPAGQVRHESICVFSSGLGDSEPLEVHLNKLIAFCAQRVGALRGLAEDCEIDLFLGISSESGQAGFVVDRGALERLARLPVSLTVDLYPPERSGEIDS
jgi:hypothetical protein